MFAWLQKWFGWDAGASGTPPPAGGVRDMLFFLFGRWRSLPAAPFVPSVVIHLVAHSNQPVALVAQSSARPGLAAHSNQPIRLIASSE